MLIGDMLKGPLISALEGDAANGLNNILWVGAPNVGGRYIVPWISGFGYGFALGEKGHGGLLPELKLALLLSHLFTSTEVADGFSWRYKAITPAACGLAYEVPPDPCPILLLNRLTASLVGGGTAEFEAKKEDVYLWSCECPAALTVDATAYISTLGPFTLYGST